MKMLGIVLSTIVLTFPATAQDRGRDAINKLPNICKVTDAEAQTACSAFFLGFIAHMEFMEVLLKRPKCLQSTDLGMLHATVLQKIPSYKSSGWVSLDLSALILETAGCKDVRP